MLRYVYNKQFGSELCSCHIILSLEIKSETEIQLGLWKLGLNFKINEVPVGFWVFCTQPGELFTYVSSLHDGLNQWIGGCCFLFSLSFHPTIVLRI